VVLEHSVCQEEEQLGEGEFCSYSAIISSPFVPVLTLFKYITLWPAVRGCYFRVLVCSSVS
jgi:hypothetical protein